MIEINSFSNPKVKNIQKLRDRGFRDETGLYLIEGYRELFRALGKAKVKELFYSEEHFLKENEFPLIDKYRSQGADIFKCSKPVFEKFSYRDRPDGLLAVACQEHKKIDFLEKKIAQNENIFLLICESLEKPGNLGTILRSADGCGVDAVVVCDKRCDIFNPNVVRASVGTLFTQDVIETTKEELMLILKEKRIKIIAASPGAKERFTEIAYQGPISIVVGSEQYGLSDFFMNNADLLVSIPMMGIADSLNVSSAATLLLYEANRQRTHCLSR